MSSSAAAARTIQQELRELLSAGENCERDIGGESFRFAFYERPRRHCDISVGPFPLATVWQNDVEFSLPKPMNNYFRVHVNGTRVNCTALQWQEDYSGVAVHVTGLNRLVKVGLSKQARIECFIGTRHLARFTQHIDSEALRNELEGHATATVSLVDERTGVEVLYCYAKEGMLLDRVTVVFPLDFVAEVLGTVRVACLQQHNGATSLSNQTMADFSNVSADVYTGHDWTLYRHAINALVRICDVRTVDDVEARWSSTQPRHSVPIMSLEIDTSAFNDQRVAYYRASLCDATTYEMSEASEAMKRIVWQYRPAGDPQDEIPSLMPFVCRETFSTRGVVWGFAVFKQVCAVPQQQEEKKDTAHVCSLYNVLIGSCVKWKRGGSSDY